MGTAKLTGFLIGIVLISLFAGTFTYFIVGMTDAYNIDYNSTELNDFNKLSEISADMEAIEDSTRETIEEDSGTIAQFVDFIKEGLQSVKTIFKSFGLYKDMADTLVTKSNIAGQDKGLDRSFVELFSKSLSLIFLIMFIVGIIISIMVKRENL